MDSTVPAKARTAFGRRVREERERRNLSQEALSAAAGTIASYLSNIECGRRSPSFDLIVSLAGALGVEIGDLFRDVPAPIKSGYSPEIVRLDSLLKDAPVEAQRAVLRVAREIVGRRYSIPRARKKTARA